jgi:hypothetical protein
MYAKRSFQNNFQRKLPAYLSTTINVKFGDVPFPDEMPEIKLDCLLCFSCYFTSTKNYLGALGTSQDQFITVRFGGKKLRVQPGLPEGLFSNQFPNLGKFWRDLEWEMQVYFMAIWNILRPFG